MIDNIPPEIQATIATAVNWLWAQYGKTAVDKVTDKAVNETKWRLGIEKYFTSLYERVGFVRILGRMEAEPLENVFTHVNVLDKLSAERRYNIDRLKTEFDPRDFEWQQRVKRISGEEAVAEYAKLFILGKPGAGKTTFLKYTALRAIKREIKKIPIFVTLKELSDSGKDIEEFIVRQFEVHRFPSPRPFVLDLLKDGEAIVLLDGLDEVNLEDNKRADLIQALNDFVYQYSDCPMLLTCRVAATEYSFTQFEYVEMADFDEGQIGRYIDQWFVGNETKRQSCRHALLEDEANKAVRELAQVPLLLALLCLVYEELSEIPAKRDEIYEEATRALLIRWDASRNVSRDTVYEQLSTKRKQQLLAQLAYINFEKGKYFLPENEVVLDIERYLDGFSGLEEVEGTLVLRAMEAQHGIFVERARGIHSFSHLTLQEYFVARYIVANQWLGTMPKLMTHVGDERWREVFLLVAGMLDDATEFCELYLKAAGQMVAAEGKIVAQLRWCEQKRAQVEVPYHQTAVRSFLLLQYCDRDFVIAFALDRVFALALALALDHALDLTFDLALSLSHTFGRTSNFDHDLAFVLKRDLDLVFAFAPDRDFDLDHAINRAFEVAKTLELGTFMAELKTLAVPEQNGKKVEWQAFGHDLATILDKYGADWNPYVQMPVTKEDLDDNWDLSDEQKVVLVQYLKANLLLVNCMKIAYVPNRQAIEDQILLPPT